MMNLLVLKERIIKIYQKTEFYVRPLLKFFVSMVVLLVINGQVGYDDRLKSIPVLLVLSALCAFTPSAVMVLIAAVFITLHVYSVSFILAVLVVAAFFILYFLFIRFTPKQGYVVVAIPILYLIKMPYIIPLLLGITAAPVSMVSAGCGILVYYLLRIVKTAAATTINSSVEDILALYKFVIESLAGNKEMLLAIGIFSIVILVTYVVRISKIDYAFYIAIGSGVITNILGFLIGDLKLNISNQIISMIFGSLGAGLIVLVIQFFRLTLDYTGVERTQFEDDDYYYYVKAVPKMKVTVPKKNVQKINVQKSTGNTLDLSQSLKKAAEDLDLEEDDFSDFEPYGSSKSASRKR